VTNSLTLEKKVLTEFLGLAPFARMNMQNEDLLPLGKILMTSLQHTATSNPNALMNYSIILQVMGLHVEGLAIQQLALESQQVFTIKAPTSRPHKKLLILMAPGDISENSPIDCLLEGEDVELIFYYITHLEDPFQNPVPEHNAVLVAMCDAKRNECLVNALIEPLQNWSNPVINRPQNIPHTNRVRASDLLRAVSGIEMPPTVLKTRADLEVLIRQTQPLTTCFSEARWPLIIRPIDSDAGRDLQRINDYEQLKTYLDKVADETEFFVSNFIDYRDQRGLYRKLRVVLIKGQPYICHVGLSKEQWIIHYVNVGMLEDADKRAEEEQVMRTFDQFIRRHKAAFDAIYQNIGLDYIGIDCAETRAGELLVFEVDHDMVVHSMDSTDLFPYKVFYIQKIKDAFMSLIPDI